MIMDVYTHTIVAVGCIASAYYIGHYLAKSSVEDIVGSMLDTLEKEGKKEVSTQKRAAWEAYLNPIKKERDEVVAMLTSLADESANKAFISPMIAALKSNTEPIRKDTVSTVKKVLFLLYPNRSGVPKWLVFSIRVHFILDVFFFK